VRLGRRSASVPLGCECVDDLLILFAILSSWSVVRMVIAMVFYSSALTVAGNCLLIVRVVVCFEWVIPVVLLLLLIESRFLSWKSLANADSFLRGVWHLELIILQYPYFSVEILPFSVQGGLW
jgi:hypothetical protein